MFLVHLLFGNNSPIVSSFREEANNKKIDDYFYKMNWCKNSTLATKFKWIKSKYLVVFSKYFICQL